MQEKEGWAATAVVDYTGGEHVQGMDKGGRKRRGSSGGAAEVDEESVLQASWRAEQRRCGAIIL